MPSGEIREAYIKNKLTDEDIKKIDIKKWVELTDGMSLSHLKELVISVVVMGKDFDESIATLNSMGEKPKVTSRKKSKLGFGN